MDFTPVIAEGTARLWLDYSPQHDLYSAYLHMPWKQEGGMDGEKLYEGIGTTRMAAIAALGVALAEDGQDYCDALERLHAQTMAMAIVEERARGA